MDPSTRPWRVLEEATAGDQAHGTGAVPPGTSSEPPAKPRLSWSVIGGFGLAVALAIGAFVVAASAPRGEVTVEGGAALTVSESPSARAGDASTGIGLVVDVQGAVLHPGVRELGAGSRVGDAIAAAGGYGPRVDAERAGRELNLAAALKDGDRIVVPSRDDPPGPSGSGPAASGAARAPGGLVDLNNATAAQLDELPGIGPVTAKKIIDARAEKPFATIDELKERKIVGASALEKLRDLVTVR